MAFQTGSQIHPELSAVNYTPFLQAASQAAQTQAQGIAALGQGAAKGFESFVEQQKQNRQLDAEIKSGEKFATAVGGFLNNINPEVATQFTGLVAGMSDPHASQHERAAIAKGIGPALNNLMALAQLGKQTQDAKKSAEYEQMLMSGGGSVPSPVSNETIASYSPEQKLVAQKRYLDVAKTSAEVGKLRAEATALATPKAGPMTETDKALSLWESDFISKNGRQPSQGEMFDQYKSMMTLKQNVTNINTGTNQLHAKAYDSLEKSMLTAQQAANLFPVYRDAKKIIDEGRFISGAGANAKLWVNKALSAFGIKNEDVSNSEVLRARLALPVMSLVRNLGSGAGITEKDVQFVEKATGADVTLESESIKRLIDIGHQIAQTTVNNYNSRLNNTFPVDSKDPTESLARRSLMISVPEVNVPKVQKHWTSYLPIK